MKYQVIKTPIFQKQLEKIILYLIENFSYKTAMKYRHFLETQLHNLEILPRRGKPINLVGLLDCLYLVSKKNIIFYQINEEHKEVHLLYITSANENYLNLL